MSNQEKKDWVNGKPPYVASPRLYAADFEKAGVQLIRSEDTKCEVLTISPWPSGDTIVAHYGPITADDLLNGIPQPPKRLPKSHPERYLGKVGSYEANDYDRIVAICGEEDIDGSVSIQNLDGEWVDCRQLGLINVIPGRYAQQGLDGIWHEVDASEDPRAQQLEESK